jgi:O-antigen/teichoic acid export membrane protein
MRELVHRISSNPKYSKVFHWSKLLTVTGSSQIIVQVVGFLCGILIIRFLSTQEYAIYTIANTMLGTIVLLSDAGIASGVMNQGGKVWNDRDKLGAVIVTGLSLRKRFIAGTLLFTLPVLLYLLLNHGASLMLSIITILCLIPLFFSNLSDILLEIPLKLKQAIVPLQKNQIIANTGRLVLTGLTVFIFPWSSVALLAAGLPRVYANRLLYKQSNELADLNQKPDPHIRKEILSIVKRVLPGAAYYSISGQITIWLISIFGTTIALAQVGAIGRLTMVLTIISTIFATLIVPGFSRLPENKKILLNKFMQVVSGLIMLSVLIVGSIALFSSQFLSILGTNYSGLNIEIVMMTISSCVGMMAGLTHAISLARGWILPPSINIAGNLITQLLLIMLLDLKTINNVILFSIINSTVAFIMLFVYFIYRISLIEQE